ncbi:hypothetical protein PF010_g12284 [Phytophthora fragariae]|uniref:PiggyBac transposable element-derived protein 4 C-terminal zinc-ribbon domain-containing protein n=1 Tax=Phytophthora fragariae TaxID=53985 RepID=A0A6A3L5X9_9STRA|nr:hypothetical protein PF011_g9419 [Phytophthora fragariae]KAE9107383.1 hypothetical protein PF010_g12284 [Phytophthora fragariae]KAE9225623.1 hypothetical protein PF004_g11879 [Phytophthora fragariae]
MHRVMQTQLSGVVERLGHVAGLRKQVADPVYCPDSRKNVVSDSAFRKQKMGERCATRFHCEACSSGNKK